MQKHSRHAPGVRDGVAVRGGVEAPARRDHLSLVARPGPAVQAASRRTGNERPLVGILAMLLCTALFPISDTTAKILTADLPSLEVAWLRYAAFLIMTLPVLLRGRSALATRRPGLQFGRALASAASTAIAILSFGFLPVAESTAIGFVAPVIVTAMAAMFLGETVGLRRWIAAAVGLVGVAVIVQPGSSAFQLVSLIPLCGSLASATSTITTRMARDERPDTTLFWSAIIGFIVLSGTVVFVWKTPSWNDVAIGGIVGFFATLASLMQVFAYRHAPASLLQPFSYSQLIWAGALGFAAFGTVPGPAMLGGAAIIAASGIYTAWREAVRSRTGRGGKGAAAHPG
jgi:drug/metabolite transporter (DMT)-like permease